MATGMNGFKSKFKDNQGRYKTYSLFYETKAHSTTRDVAVFSLMDDDREIDGVLYPSLKKMYLEAEDITEYLFVTEHMGTSWEHWQRLCRNKLIFRYIKPWAEELEIKLRAKGIKSAVDLAGNGNYSASKFLADRGWLDKDEKKKDATKDKVKEETSPKINEFLQRVK